MARPATGFGQFAGELLAKSVKRDLKRLVKSVFRTLWWRLKGVPVFAPEDVREDRRRICHSCDFNDDGDCRICTCDIKAKTLLSSESCPASKWGTAK